MQPRRLLVEPPALHASADAIERLGEFLEVPERRADLTSRADAGQRLPGFAEQSRLQAGDRVQRVRLEWAQPPAAESLRGGAGRLIRAGQTHEAFECRQGRAQPGAVERVVETGVGEGIAVVARGAPPDRPDHEALDARKIAYVSLTGVLQRSNRATTSAKIGTGQYEVTFDRNVSACTYAGALSAAGASGHIQIDPRNGAPNAIYVQTNNSSGTGSDRSFYVEVTC